MADSFRDLGYEVKRFEAKWKSIVDKYKKQLVKDTGSNDLDNLEESIRKVRHKIEK